MAEQNLKSFEELEREDQAFREEMKEIRAKAKELGLDGLKNISLDDLPEEQARELKRMQDEAQRELEEAMSSGRTGTSSRRSPGQWMRI